MRDRDILESFDAALPHLEVYTPGCVPTAGSKELVAYQERAADRRITLGMSGVMTTVAGACIWLLWSLGMPITVLVISGAITAMCGINAAKMFLQLAFSQRLEQALPAGTDAVTAQLEDGAWNLIRPWNADAFVWNQRVARLRLEVSDWQLLKNVPEARDIEWTEAGSRSRAEGLVAAMQGLASDRAALVARQQEIEHRLGRLDARLRQLKESEEKIVFALPPPAPEDPEHD